MDGRKAKIMAPMQVEQATVQIEEVATGRSESRHSAWRTGENAHVVILKSGDGYFGIDINLVQEIVLMQEITHVPGSAAHMAGMTDLRGRVVPVAEFAILLGQEPGDRTDDTRILVVEDGGSHIRLIVDAVTEVLLVDGAQIEQATTIGSLKHEFIFAVAKLDGYLVSLLDIELLIEMAGGTKSVELAA